MTTDVTSSAPEPSAAETSAPVPSALAPAWLRPRTDTADLEEKLFPVNTARDSAGELSIGGMAVSDLAQQFGTPLYVFDEDDFRHRARQYRDAFSVAFNGLAEVDVFYAGKAFLSTAVASWVQNEGLYVDTASYGELAIALAAGVDPARIGLHGNNKSDAEISLALDSGISRLVADSVEEISRINQIALSLGVIAPVMLRITPGVHASTHDYIATAHEDQKFGLSLHPGQGDRSAAWQAIEAALGADSVELRGLHCHIGSQIFEPDGFEVAAIKVLDLLAEVKAAYDVELPELDLGGGYGIAYTEADHPRPPTVIAQALAATVGKRCTELGLDVPRISIEPGRSIAGPAGVTLYTVGAQKDVLVDDEHSRRYIAVDGGMGDNARPVLYDADYSAVLASRKLTGEHLLSRIVGKHCESGDIVVRNVYLPAAVTRGDILAVPATGAYCHSLSSNYNYLPRPAVVAVSQGQAQVLIEAETHTSMLARDPGYRAATTEGQQ